MSLFILHPTGNPFVRALIEESVKRGLKYQFFTTLSFSEADWIPRLAMPSVRRQLLRRDFGVDGDHIHTRPWREAVRLLAMRFGIPSLTQHETGWACVDAVYQDLDRHVARAVTKCQPCMIHAYEDGAEHSFTAGKALGIRCQYELPIVYWEVGHRILQQEAERLPLWAPTLGGIQDSELKRRRKTRELELADRVICPSEFVRQSVPARWRSKSVVAEFGSPSVSSDTASRPRSQRTPLRVLFAGSMTQRKGLADVFAAVKLLRRSDVELVVLGSPVAPMAFYREQYPDFIHESPRPHAEVIELMKTCDVLVLPSLVEGRALVQQEALACGLPLIVTPNAGGEDLIEAGRTGFLVPPGSPASLAEKLSWFADQRGTLEEMRELCRRKARHYTWGQYAAKILEAQP